MPEEVKGNSEAPAAEYEIEHVYGYRAADCQQNLYVIYLSLQKNISNEVKVVRDRQT